MTLSNRPDAVISVSQTQLDQILGALRLLGIIGDDGLQNRTCFDIALFVFRSDLDLSQDRLLC